MNVELGVGSQSTVMGVSAFDIVDREGENTGVWISISQATSKGN